MIASTKDGQNAGATDNAGMQPCGLSPPGAIVWKKMVGSIQYHPSLGKDGGRDRDRTCDPYHVKVVLSR